MAHSTRINTRWRCSLGRGGFRNPLGVGGEAVPADGPNRIREYNARAMEPNPACEFPIPASIGMQMLELLEV